MRRHILILPLLLAFAACSHNRPQTGPVITQQGTPSAVRGRVADHVIIISVDGLRPDAIERFEAKNIQRLMREGRYSLTAQTISISKTLPSHTSMLTGVGAETHGITWNSDRTGEFGHVKVPTVFGLAHQAGFSTAAFFSKTKFQHLDVPSTIDHMRAPTGGVIPWNARKTIDLMRDHLDESAPNLMVVHLADADFTGHNFGWMGWMYGMAVREVDLAVGNVINAADERFGRGGYTVILTADHGGHNKSHGSTDPVDTTIPWIVWGAGVQPGDTLSGIRTMDTAATALWMLGLEAPESFVGKPVLRAFQPAMASGR